MDTRQTQFQVYCNRHDGQGWVLDGCWGSEYASGTLNECTEMVTHLRSEYPDCEWDMFPMREY